MDVPQQQQQTKQQIEKEKAVFKMCKEITIYNERVEIVPLGKRVEKSNVRFYGIIKGIEVFIAFNKFFIQI